jgi:hypothetical protein
MLFHRWVVSKPRRFITTYSIFKWSSITDCHLNQLVTCSKVNACGTKHEKTCLYSLTHLIYNDSLPYSFLGDVKPIHYHSKWQVTTFSMLLSVQYNPRVTTTSGVVLNIFLPYM